MQALCSLYDVPAAHTSLLVEMAKSTQEKGDWLESSPQRFGLYLLMEKRATSVTTVTLDVIHGLLQTPEYHEALQADYPYPSPDDAVAQRNKRQERQAAFWDRGDACLKVVMSEAALRRLVGSSAIMAEQIIRLRYMARRDGVSIRYIPLDYATAPSLPGAFTLITTELGTSAYTEHLGGGRVLSAPTIVTQARALANLATKASRDIGEWQ
ncbi:hypothetical protein GCM10022223_12570 [Kineosporia mesophila]|uniref:DUF5753 domain-containing protein n=1 Tax=Kineosporia mesophila TaxID=566012 RepID=A0ABP6Z687_9ACTN